jgi:hypothetical protein
MPCVTPWYCSYGLIFKISCVGRTLYVVPNPQNLTFFSYLETTHPQRVSQLQNYLLLQAVSRNIPSRIKQATCFGLLSHHQAVIKNIGKSLDIAIGARSVPSDWTGGNCLFNVLNGRNKPKHVACVMRDTVLSTKCICGV